MKVIECGYMRAEVDMTDINDPSITVSMIKPITVFEYHSNFDVWHWDRDISVDTRALYAEVDSYIATERIKARREKLCAVS